MPATPRLTRLALLAAPLAVLLIAALYILQRKPKPAPPPPPPVTLPAAPPQTAPATAPAGPATFLELIRELHADYPATQPASRPLPLAHAGHFVIPHPVHLDSAGHAWITRADAPEAATHVGQRIRESILLTPLRPVFVHYATTRDGIVPWVVQRNASGDGFELFTGKASFPIGRGDAYDWDRAFSWDHRIVVPTPDGLSVFTVTDSNASESPSLPLAEGEHAPVQVAFLNGPIAWVPPTEGHPGSTGAVRCVDTAWIAMRGDDWPAGLLQLIPLLDGSVLQIIATGPGKARTALAPISAMAPETRKEIEELIYQLSDENPRTRQKAFEQLTRYGPGLWPIAEQMLQTEPAETRSRLRDLLRSKSAPLLGGMHLEGEDLRILQRHRDGGALLYAGRGVSIPQGDEPATTIAPAWLSIRPGEPVELLPPDLVHDLDPAKARLAPSGRDWIILDDVNGARTWIGPGTPLQLTREPEREHAFFLGRDRDGRYYLANASGSATLIIDTTLPDPAPRLPGWAPAFENAQAGWNKDDWPAVKHTGAWALGATGWVPMPADEPFHADRTKLPPTTAPTSRPAGIDAEPILVAPSGRAYYDGRETLIQVDPDGTTCHWTLPPVATGDASCDAFLVETSQGVLYLYNQPGRLLRIRPTPAAAEPFRIEATFARRIPNEPHPQRMWLDPFGRICFACSSGQLVVLFPDGFIPADIASLMDETELESLD